MGQVRRLGVAASVVDGALVPGDVAIADGVVEAVGLSPAGSGGVAVAGFVDLQVNGLLGVSFAECDADGYARVGEAMARTGTTAYLPTIPSSPADRYAGALDVAARAVAEGPRPGAARALGVHLEGPFLAHARRGAHRETDLRAPDLALVADWVARAPVRLMTLAPELPGALDIARRLRSLGIVVSMGHTDADAHVAGDAVEAGFSAHTHVWNASGPPRAREAGTVGVALARAEVTPMFIADLVHVSAEVLGFSLAATADRYVVVSDVAPAAGTGDRRHGADGVRLSDGTLAGASSLLDQSLRNLLAIGRPLVEAVASVTSRPAVLIGHPDLGVLAPGAVADVVVLDDAFEVVDVVVRGESVR